MKGDWKNSLLVVIILVGMSIPTLQTIFPFLDEKPLNGAVVLNEKPEASLSSWFDGSYQEQTEAYLKDHFGFRPYFVRLHNQINYSLFGEIAAKSVVRGKDGYLFEENYLKAYYGMDHVGDEVIEQETTKLKQVQDSLAKKGISLLVVLAPGKGSFYPEYFPEEWKGLEKRATNYDSYKRTFKEKGVHFIDLKAWFSKMKHKSPYPLYPKAGIHWSKYGEYLAADSLLRYLNMNMGLNCGSIELGSIETSAENRDGDYDIGEGANLLFQLPTYPMAYPNYSFITKGETDRVLVVSDSYYWGLFNKGISLHCFGNGQFWFYNEGIYPDSYEKPITVKDISVVNEVNKNKAVILMTTDANLFRFPYGFVDRILNEMK